MATTYPKAIDPTLRVILDDILNNFRTTNPNDHDDAYLIALLTNARGLCELGLELPHDRAPAKLYKLLVTLHVEFDLQIGNAGDTLSAAEAFDFAVARAIDLEMVLMVDDMRRNAQAIPA